MRYLMQFEEVFFINKIKKNKIDKKINDICKEYGIRDYTINKDGSIDVHSSVYLIDFNFIILIILS